MMTTGMLDRQCLFVAVGLPCLFLNRSDRCIAVGRFTLLVQEQMFRHLVIYAFAKWR